MAFTSAALNFDERNAPGAFVHDTRSGRTLRAVPHGISTGRSLGISGNGRYVVFETSSRVQGTGTSGWQVYVRDLRTGRIVLVSKSSRGEPSNGSFATFPSISADGRYISFTSNATSLVPGNSVEESCQCVPPAVYWHDTKRGRTLRVSVASDGAEASFAAFPSCAVGGTLPRVVLPEPLPSLGGGGGLLVCDSYTYDGNTISSDGRYVMFESTATNLVPNDTNMNSWNNLFGQDVFVHDVMTRRTERVSVTSYGEERRGYQSLNGAGALSGNGRFASYKTSDADGDGTACELGGLPWHSLVTSVLGLATCQRIESAVYDRAAGAVDVVAPSVTGGRSKPGACSSFDNALGIKNAFSGTEALSADGRYVALFSSAQDLVADDTNNHCDYFVRDRGKSLGAGGFGGRGSAGAPGPGANELVCVGDDVCLPPVTVADSTGGIHTEGADLIGAQVVPRPGLHDLFVRLDLARMATISGAPSGGLLYGLRFTANGERYEVRAQRVPGADFNAKGGASFGLFRQDRVTGLYTKVTALKGGYGTTGPSVVVAVPLKELEVSAAGQLSDVRAFTGVGSFLTGATKVLDTVRLVP